MIKYSTNRSVQPCVTFWGAAQSVTGSMHLIEFADRRLLLDCGLVRGPREDSRLRNRHFPFDPATVDAVVLSHSHVDHCGNLPNLVRQGFTGPIYCTPATRDLIAIMLADSARIQEDDAFVQRVARHRSAEPGPLYTCKDAEQTIRQCVPVAYDTPADLCLDAQLRLLDAGHILGSAVVALELITGGRTYRVTFTGDLGRRGLPFLPEPPKVPAADLIISESTYGGRRHDTLGTMAAKMAEVVGRTAARGGKVLIPAFSLGRTQVVVHFLRRWMRDGILPHLPLYVDSPLAAEIAHVYERHADRLVVSPLSGDLPPVHYVATHEEAREVSTQPESCVIVASGGMCEGGRILQHLRLHVDDPRASIVLVSYQAPHSLGAQLLELKPTVRFHGRTWNKWAEVVQMNGFSGHADHDDFLALLGPAAEDTRHVCLVHGEPPQAETLARGLREVGFADVCVPHPEEQVQFA
jgi:metallo-beta-lactamase family protein